MEKLCTKCNQPKLLTDFNFKNKVQNKLNAWCKQCLKTYDKARRAEHPELWLQYNKERKQDLKNWLNELKSSLHCAECPENHPACLQFHHTNPEEKDSSVAAALHDGWSKERILREISKCVVLCANCHFKFHYTHK